jgi:hypothetical protein
MSQPYSSFWLKRFDFKKFRSMDKTAPAYLLALSSIRRGVENFVRIVAEREIPVKYVTSDHVAAGEAAIFDATKAQIEISAPDDIDKVDAIVGRAIAEGVHMVLSHQTHTEESIPVFVAVQHVHEMPSLYCTGALFTELERLQLSIDDFAMDLTRFLLVLEDRRCDAWMYSRAPGYRPYYEEMYRELWQSDDVAMVLSMPETHEPTLDNYRFRVTNVGHPDMDPQSLPGLADIVALFDLDHVARFAHDVKIWHTYRHNYGIDTQTMQQYFDDKFLPEMIVVARTAVLEMYRQCPTPEPQPQPEADDATEEDQPQPSTTPAGPHDPNGPVDPQLTGDEDADADMDEEPAEVDPTLTPTQHMVRGLQKALDDDLYHTTEKCAVDDASLSGMEALDSADADMREVGKGMQTVKGDPITKVPCIVYRRLTDQLLNSENFPFAQSRNTSGKATIQPNSAQALTDGTHMGNALAHRIQVLADESKLIITRQKKGQIDKRLLANLGFDSDAVFCETIIERKEPIVLHFSVDASGSMAGPKWQKALTVAVALARTAKQIRTLDVTISLRSSDHFGNAAVAMIFDSRRDSFEHVRHFFPYLCAASATPEGLAFEAIRNEIISMDPKARKFFVNISDGAPSFQSYQDRSLAYHGEAAYRHTAQQMRDFREAGITVLSYFVSDGYGDHDKDAFRKMYGREAEFIEVEKVTQIARTLNKMFMRDAG